MRDALLSSDSSCLHWVHIKQKKKFDIMSVTVFPRI